MKSLICWSKVTFWPIHGSISNCKEIHYNINKILIYFLCLCLFHLGMLDFLFICVLNFFLLGQGYPVKVFTARKRKRNRNWLGSLLHLPGGGQCSFILESWQCTVHHMYGIYYFINWELLLDKCAQKELEIWFRTPLAMKLTIKY